jgi:hypothetical protein
MGAIDIEDGAMAPTMGEAYQRCVDNALHYSGHDPYNGTISTTNGFIDQTKHFNNLVAGRRKTKKVLTECYNQWLSDAWDNTNKWDEVWGMEYPWNKATKKRKQFYFAGWAAE